VAIKQVDYLYYFKLTGIRCKKFISSIPSIYKGQISKSIALFKGKRSVKKVFPKKFRLYGGGRFILLDLFYRALAPNGAKI
jgi:hypothetical protein